MFSIRLKNHIEVITPRPRVFLFDLSSDVVGGGDLGGVPFVEGGVGYIQGLGWGCGRGGYIHGWGVGD